MYSKTLKPAASGSGKKPPTSNRGVTFSLGNENWSGIDYYTATARDKNVGHSWATLWNAHRLQASKAGNKVKVFKKYSYNCQNINGLTYGESDEFGFMMVASSDVAHQTWSKVLPSARNITRLDLQYSFVADKEQGDDSLNPIMRQYIDLRDSEHAKSRSYACIENSDGGETMYINSRSSDQFGRFYNKSVESGLEVKNVYRLEVEYKALRSFALFKSMYEGQKKALHNPTRIRDVVLSWFETRGVVVNDIFRRVKGIALGKTLTSDERKYKWLRTSVSPTLVDLADRGRLKELAGSLGLTSSQYRQLAMWSQNDVDLPQCKHDLHRGICRKCGQCFT